VTGILGYYIACSLRHRNSKIIICRLYLKALRPTLTSNLIINTEKKIQLLTQVKRTKIALKYTYKLTKLYEGRKKKKSKIYKTVEIGTFTV
jgi:hypothetical protein